MKIKIKPAEIVFITVIILITTLIMYPVFQKSPSPSWPYAAEDFLKTVGAGLNRYQEDHSGKLSESLAELYPKYVNDPRLTKSSVEIGPLKKPMVLTYHKPKSLADRSTVVAELRLHPNDKSRYHYRGVALKADLNVRLKR